MYIKSISSCPLIKSPDTGLCLPDESRRRILTIGRRRFIKLASATVIGFAGANAINSLFPERADAQWYKLIPVILTGIEIAEHLYHFGQELIAKFVLENQSPQAQAGHLNIRLISYVDQPIGRQFYEKLVFVDHGVPRYTKRTYTIGGLPAGPEGQNKIFGYTASNDTSESYTVKKTGTWFDEIPHGGCDNYHGCE